MSKSLKAQNSKEVTVNTSTGEAYISQRKAAEKLGMTHQAIQQWCLARNYDVKEGLSLEVFTSILLHFATASRKVSAKSAALFKHLHTIENWTLDDVLSFEYVPKKKLDTSGFVYLVGCNEFYKIGVSKTSVESRLAALQTGNPYPLSILFYKRVKNAYRAESHLHNEYCEFWHTGEWFTGFDVEEVIKYMDTVR